MVESYVPKTLEEALNIRSKEATIILAGGTDLMVSHFISSNTIIKFDLPVLHLRCVNELKKIEVFEDKIIIGSATTFNDIIQSEYIPLLLKEASLHIAGPPIRNMATIGGNICNASPSADSLPPLYVMNASVTLKSKSGERNVLIKDFITGVGKTSIKDDEILTSIVIPKEKYEYEYYRKVGTRRANALSKLAMSSLVIKNKNDFSFRISFCTLDSKITRSENIEKKFITDNINTWKNNIKEIQEEYKNIIKPRNSNRSTAFYREKVALSLIEYFFTQVVS